MSLIIPANSASAAGGYAVDNSCRFNGTAAYLNRTQGTSTNLTKFAWSGWIKRSKLAADQVVTMNYASASNYGYFYFRGTDDLRIFDRGAGGDTVAISDMLFRDISAWYHIALIIDTTQATNTNRLKLYVNGILQGLNGVTYPAENASLGWKVANTSNTFLMRANSADSYVGGYLAEVAYVDGTANAITDFGEFDEDSGIWKPIDVSGLTFGNEGYYLDFQDSANLGNDVTGGTDFTENSLAAIDQTTDTPTNNFITLNPLITLTSRTDNQVYSEGNTIVIPNSTDNYGTAFGTFGATRGKWYWEAQIIWNGTSNNANFPKQIGFMREDYAFNKSYLGQNDDQTWGVAFHDLGTDGWGLDHNGSFSAISGATTLADDKMVMFALDLDNGKFYMGYDGSWFTSGDPTSGATGTGAIATLDATDLSFTIIPALTNATNTTYYKMNFGNPAYAIASSNTDGDGFGNFEFAVPSGYFSWCTKNLAEYG